MKSYICLLALIVSSAFHLHAWSGGGHKVVAQIAYERLTPELRAKIAALLEEHPRFKEDFMPDMPAEIQGGAEAEDRARWVFAQAAIWPDKPRGYDAATMQPLIDTYHRGPWHYFNTPVFLNDASRAALEGRLQVNVQHEWKPGMDEMSLSATQMLHMAVVSLRDAVTPDERKALLVSWVMHVVGDLHQPMHNVALFADPELPDLREGDRGGNRLFWPDDSPFKRMTLHAFWDLQLRSNIDLRQARDKASELLADTALTSQAEKSLAIYAPKQWVEEGAALAREHAYTSEVLSQIAGKKPDALGDIEITPLSAEYKKQALEVSRGQVVIAGYRLAQLLASAFAAP